MYLSGMTRNFPLLYSAWWASSNLHSKIYRCSLNFLVGILMVFDDSLRVFDGSLMVFDGSIKSPRFVDGSLMVAAKATINIWQLFRRFL